MWPSPTFVQVKPSSIVDEYMDRYVEYKFPEILDMNINDTYDVQVTGLKRWMFFNKTKGLESL